MNWTLPFYRYKKIILKPEVNRHRRVKCVGIGTYTKERISKLILTYQNVFHRKSDNYSMKYIFCVFVMCVVYRLF